MQNIQGIKFKLKTKEQWFCDVCGGVIETAKDGMLEWDSLISEEGMIDAKNFRIVHVRSIEGCKNNRSEEHLADGHLHWFTGPNGLNNLLSMYERYTFDPIEFNKIIRRIHVDFYEEGARLSQLAREDSYEIDPYDSGDINQDDLLWLIRKYGNEN